MARDRLARTGGCFSLEAALRGCRDRGGAKGAPGVSAPVSLKTLQEGRFVNLRPRTDERGGPSIFKRCATNSTWSWKSPNCWRSSCSPVNRTCSA